MSTVIACDGCATTLDREDVVEVQIGRGTLVASGLTEPRFVGSELPVEWVLCTDCAGYVERCVDVLRTGAAS